MKLRWPVLSLPLSLLFFWAVVLLLMQGAAAPVVSAEAEPYRAVRQRIAAADEVRALIMLQIPAAEGAALAPEIASAQRNVLAALAGTGFHLRHRYGEIPAVAGDLTAGALAALQRHPLVAGVHLDEPGSGQLGETVAAVRADRLQSHYGLTGAGVRVAVVDSGVDSDHPDLVDAIFAQQCFTDGDCPPFDSASGSSAEDEHGHGTNVAGIIGGDGNVASAGLAPDAALAAVRVLDADNAGWVSDWVAALDWLIANQPTLQIDLINMSLGTWTLYAGNCDREQPELAYAIARLNALGIAVFASSGNQGSLTSISAPACLSDVVAVAATYDAELGREPDGGSYEARYGASWPDCADDSVDLSTIACFSNHNALVDVAAPGARLTAAGLGGGRSTFVGTSMATAATTGVAALLRQANPAVTPEAIESLLEENGSLVVNPRNDLVLPRIDALRAARSFLPVLPAGADIDGRQSSSVGHAIELTATAHPFSATWPLTYSWQAAGQLPVQHRGGLQDVVTFTWFVSGTYPITLTVANAAGRVTATHAVTLAAVDATGVTIAGPSSGSSGTPQLFVATIQPLTASLPITYQWAATGQQPLIHTAGVSDGASFTWAAAGRYTLTVTASNLVRSVTATHVITIVDVAPLTVTLLGPLLGATDFIYPFAAAVTPITVSLPMTYAWTATGQMPVTRTGGPLDGITLSWELPGRYTVAVTATNRAGSVSQQQAIVVIDGRSVYLPLLQRKE